MEKKNLDLIIGNNIRKYRALIGWSQAALGKELDVSFQQIQKYERGINRVSAPTLYKIAKALNVRIMDLYGEEDAVTYNRADIDMMRRYKALKLGVQIAVRQLVYQLGEQEGK